MKCFLIIFCVISSAFYSQNRELYGKISLQNSKEVYKGNLIFKPKKNSVKIIFVQTDTNGNYKAKLENEVAYTLEIPFLSKAKSTYEIDEKKSGNYDIELSQEKITEIQEVNIKYQMPITIKEDTLIYKVSAFTNGSERKLGDVVKKLPGFEVSKDGAVKVNGKPIGGTMVEGSPFFNGNTSLAMKSLPADALSEIEVIDNYSDNKIRSSTTGENATVLNIKLKKEKKELWFGDAVLGGNEKGYYHGHVNLFKFSKKYNFSTIADANNIGETSLSFEDVMSMNGGVMAFINNSRLAEEIDQNLFSLALPNPNFLKKSNQLLTTNFQKNNQTTKHDWNFLFLSNNTQNLNTNSSFSLDKQYNEETESRSEASTQMFQSSLKTTYSKNPNSIFNNYLLLKVTNIQNDFSNISKINQLNFNQNRNNELQTYQIRNNLSMDKVLSKKMNLSAFFKIDYNLNANHNQYLSDNAFLNNYVPKNEQNQYFLSNNLRNEKLILSLGGSFNYRITALSKLLFEPLIFVKKTKISVLNSPNLLTSDFLDNFGYQQVTTNLKTSYIHKLDGHLLKIGADFSSNFVEISEKKNKVYDNNNLLGFLDYKYEWKPSHYLNIIYNAKTSYLNEINYSTRYQILGFNQIIKFDENNKDIQNLSHNLSFKYLQNNLYYKFGYSFDASYKIQEKGFINAVDLNATQALQRNRYLYSDNTNRSLNFSVDLNKEIKKINIYTNFTHNTNYNLRIINSLNSEAKGVSKTMKIGLQSKFKKIPWDFDVFYLKNWDTTYFGTATTFSSEVINIDSRLKFYQFFTFKLNGSSSITQALDGSKKTFNSVNTSLAYDNPNHFFGYELAVNNLTNNSTIFDNSISGNFATQSSQFVLPRIIVLKVMFSF